MKPWPLSLLAWPPVWECTKGMIHSHILVLTNPSEGCCLLQHSSGHCNKVIVSNPKASVSSWSTLAMLIFLSKTVTSILSSSFPGTTIGSSLFSDYQCSSLVLSLMLEGSIGSLRTKATSAAGVSQVSSLRLIGVVICNCATEGSLDGLQLEVSNYHLFRLFKLGCLGHQGSSWCARMRWMCSGLSGGGSGGHSGSSSWYLKCGLDLVLFLLFPPPLCLNVCNKYWIQIPLNQQGVGRYPNPQGAGRYPNPQGVGRYPNLQAKWWVPYPCLWVWVWVGMGKGIDEDTLGLPLSNTTYLSLLPTKTSWLLIQLWGNSLLFDLCCYYLVTC